MLTPSREEFMQHAKDGRPTLVYRDLLADFETPLAVYWRLAHDEPYSFLLESVTGGEQLARYSILGVRPRAVIRTKGTSCSVINLVSGQTTNEELPEDRDPLDVLKAHLPPAPRAAPGMPKFAGGAVGMMGYDIVRFFERLPDGTLDDLNLDDLAMMVTGPIVVFDHAKNSLRIIATAEGTPEKYDEAAAEIERIADRLKTPLPELPGGKFQPHEVKSNFQKEKYLAAIERTKEYIAAGDGIQTVVAQRFETDVDAHPLTIYRALRSLNPSPYMFLLRFGDFDVVGASPEILVSLDGTTARVRPIAGTRWRGGSHEEDIALGEELLADEKERAEHIMLVDLGRNDLGRVCKYGTVKVNELMEIERYSHVMHIVSDVTGELSKREDAMSLIRVTFPAGTVSGAPKVRAMEIIDELEPTRRGLYAGAIGYVSSQGDMDMCIAIRTILLKNGKAYVQAGGGIVYDSVPEKEFQESCNKAKACLKAIEMAQLGLED
jgi:anthranilate synthase component 1